ncbi:MAG: ACP S-malonyltransferase [Planctomycetota bacterium]
MTPAILLPGQGAQTPGMGRSWYEAFPTARSVFDRADEVLDFGLTRACFEGGDEVHRTDVAQPGILTTSIAILSVLVERGLDLAQASMAGGLSLGEYTALWVAGSLDFDDAVRLVRLRGEAMQAASEQTPSSMTSLMGADFETATKLAAIGAEQGICAVANLNSPGQIVLSGELAALDAVEAAAKEHGVRRAVRLTVAGGFHSECMRPAAEQLRVALAEVELRVPQVPFVTNVTGEPVDDVERIRGYLADQVCSPVLWEKSMRWAVEAGHRSFLEPGPGAVLSALVRKVDREVETRSVEQPDQVEQAFA